MGKMVELTKVMIKCNIDLIDLQEIRWKGIGFTNKRNCKIFYSGESKQGKNGVAFMLTNEMESDVMDFRAIKQNNIYTCAPTKEADEQVRNDFYEELEKVCGKLPKQDRKIGKEEYVIEIGGKYSYYEKTNDNGIRLCNAATALDIDNL